MKKYNYTYVTINLINVKKYIGDHTTDDLDDGYLGSGIALQRAIKKYDKTQFKKEILEFFDTKQEAFNAQEKWINEYNTLVPNGYNISLKGGHQCKNSISEETKKKISITTSLKLKGRKLVIEVKKNPKGIKVSDMEAPLGETRMKIGFVAKKLLDDGKILKVNNLYFPKP